MGRKARKLNFLIDENICQSLEALVPSGKRSRVASEALRKELELIRRENAVKELLGASHKGKKFSNRQIADRLAKDRSGH